MNQWAGLVSPKIELNSYLLGTEPSCQTVTRPNLQAESRFCLFKSKARDYVLMAELKQLQIFDTFDKKSDNNVLQGYPLFNTVLLLFSSPAHKADGKAGHPCTI